VLAINTYVMILCI